MFTPILSFATANNAKVDVPASDKVTGPYIVGAVDENELPEAQRKVQALDDAIVDKADEIYGHKFIASNGKYELYRKDSNCSIIIRDVETGAILSSTVTDEALASRKYAENAASMITSGIAITSIKKSDDNKATKEGPIGVKNATITYKEGKNGFTAHIDFKNLGISFDVVVELDEEGLQVNVPKSSIVESDPAIFLGELYIFNGLGMTERGDREGYMILPDGNGIKVDFINNFYVYGDNKVASKYSSGYIQRVYGTDISFDTSTGAGYDDVDLIGTSNSNEQIIAPYWGMVHTDSQLAVLGVINKGETSAKIVGNFNGVANLYENYSGCMLLYRDIYKRNLSDTIQYQSTIDAVPAISLIEDASITFMFTSGDKANYIGLAEAYRNKLIADGDLVKTADGTFNTRIDFLGTDKENFLVFKQDVVATTVDNVRSILNDLKADGVENVLAIYTGWQDGGVNATPVKKYDVESSIGGNSEMNKLVNELKGSSVSLYLMTDMQLINKAVTSSSYDAVKSYAQRTYEIYSPFLKVYKNFRYLIPSLSNEYMLSLAEDMKKDDLTNIAFSGISSRLFAYYIDGTQYSRNDVVEYYTSALKQIKDNGMNVVLEKPFKYLWKYTDSFVDMPLYSSMFVYTSEEIPFLTSVLKGTVDVYSEYVNFEANAKEYFLKLVETGVYPSFLITDVSPNELLYTNSNWIYSSQYDQYNEKIVDYYNQLKAINDKIGDSCIVAHKKENKVSTTVYENGVVVYVNFSEKNVVTEDGTLLEPLSYKVGEAE